MFKTSALQEMVETGSVIEIPWQLIRPFGRQPRKYFNKTKLEALQCSIQERGQKTPATVRVLWGGTEQQFELVDGERRLRACTALDRPLRAWVVNVEDPEEQYEASIMANCNRADHTPLELAAAVQLVRHSKRIKGFPARKQIAAVGATFGRSEAWVNQYLSLNRLVAELRKRLEPGVKKKERLSLTLAFRLSTLPANEQSMQYEAIRKKRLSNRQAQRHIDKTILSQGLHQHRRGRRPSDEFDLMVRFARKTQHDGADLLGLDDAELQKMITNRPSNDRKNVLDELLMASQTLDRIRQRVQEAIAATPVVAMN